MKKKGSRVTNPSGRAAIKIISGQNRRNKRYREGHVMNLGMLHGKRGGRK